MLLFCFCSLFHNAVNYLLGAQGAYFKAKVFGVGTCSDWVHNLVRVVIKNYKIDPKIPSKTDSKTFPLC